MRLEDWVFGPLNCVGSEHLRQCACASLSSGYNDIACRSGGSGGGGRGLARFVNAVLFVEMDGGVGGRDRVKKIAAATATPHRP